MGNETLSNFSQSPFAPRAEIDQTTRCTPDNPFGAPRRPSAELRKMEGVHYTYDPTLKSIKILRAIQNAPQHAIGVAVGLDVLATFVAIEKIEALIWGSDITKAMLDFFEKLLDELPDPKEHTYKEPASEQSNTLKSENHDRIKCYNERQETKSNDNTTDDEDN